VPANARKRALSANSRQTSFHTAADEQLRDDVLDILLAVCSLKHGAAQAGLQEVCDPGNPLGLGTYPVLQVRTKGRGDQPQICWPVTGSVKGARRRCLEHVEAIR
jgi:hypothetical protein